jgi:hypothetical protein
MSLPLRPGCAVDVNTTEEAEALSVLPPVLLLSSWLMPGKSCGVTPKIPNPEGVFCTANMDKAPMAHPTTSGAMLNSGLVRPSPAADLGVDELAPACLPIDFFPMVSVRLEEDALVVRPVAMATVY